ncbi:MAG: AMP-binding protein, partial [Thermodesulfobacteriota bacterium]|nr:AMP-binding protein [Thermodesulfobacteriota bacterium]
WASVMKLGREYDREHPNAFESNIESGKGEDIAVILYTSGTSGLPKGVLRTHYNMVIGGYNWCYFCGIDETWSHLSFYPPAWITEQIVGIAGGLWAGHMVSFPESPDTAEDDCREIGPTIFFTAPRIWEGLASMVQAKISDAPFLKRLVYHMFLPIGYKMAGFIQRDEKPGLFWRALYSIAYILVFRPIKDKLGLLKTKLACTAGALLSPDAFNYFWAIGVPLQQMYGLTEVAPITMQMVDGSINEIDTGPPLPGVELKISHQGEILIKSKDLLFPGYYKSEEITKKAIRDGWFHTGDAGYINEEGHLIIIDRLADLAELPNGAKYSPQFIESRLKFSPYVKDAIILGGEGKPEVTVLVGIDLQNVGRWAEKKKISFTTFTDLSQRPQVYDLIQGELERVNESLPIESKIKRFANLYKELDPDEAELTRTRKLRRGFFEETYEEIIKGLYFGDKHVQVDAEIKYRDGKKGRLRTTVEIRSIEVSG